MMYFIKWNFIGFLYACLWFWEGNQRFLRPVCLTASAKDSHNFFCLTECHYHMVETFLKYFTIFSFVQMLFAFLKTKKMLKTKSQQKADPRTQTLNYAHLLPVIFITWTTLFSLQNSSDYYKRLLYRKFYLYMYTVTCLRSQSDLSSGDKV